MHTLIERINEEMNFAGRHQIVFNEPLSITDFLIGFEPATSNTPASSTSFITSNSLSKFETHVFKAFYVEIPSTRSESEAIDLLQSSGFPVLTWINKNQTTTLSTLYTRRAGVEQYRSIDESPKAEEAQFISKALLHHMILAPKNAILHYVWPKDDFVAVLDPNGTVKDPDRILKHIDFEMFVEVTASSSDQSTTLTIKPKLLADASEGFEFKEI